LKAGGAKPEGIDSQSLLFQTEQGISNDLVRTDFHPESNRASSRAVPALIAGKQVLPADQFYLLGKFIVYVLSCQFDFHDDLIGGPSLYGNDQDKM
jgi:hypothetical protein